MISSQDDTFWVKKQKQTYKFRHSVDKVWNFIKDVDQTYKILGDFRSEAVFTKGEKSYEVDSEFSFTWKGFIKLKFKVLKVVDTDEFKQLVYLVESEPKLMKYEYVYSLFRVSAEKEEWTLLKWEWNYDGEKGIRINKMQSDLICKERNLMLTRIDHFLSVDVRNLNQVESMDLPISARNLWKIITDWRIFRKISPSVCDHCEYQGEGEEVGTLLKLIWDEEKKAVCYLKVIHSLFNDNIFGDTTTESTISTESDAEVNPYLPTTHHYNLLCYLGEPAVPQQEIRFTIYEIDDKLSLLKFEHIYLDPVNPSILPALSKYKKSILKDLKKNLKKYKNKTKIKLTGDHHLNSSTSTGHSCP